MMNISNNMNNYNIKNKYIKETCVKLEFRNEMLNDVFIYFDMFISSNTHNFSDDVIMLNIIFTFKISR